MFLLGAQCGSPATTAPNGDHLLLDSGIFNQDLINTVPGEAIPVTSGLQAIIPGSTSICDVVNTCIVLNEDKVDTVLPPLRDDVPLSVACPSSVFVACDILLFSVNLLASHQHNLSVSVSPGLGEPNTLDSPSSWTTMQSINLFPNMQSSGRPPDTA